MLTRGTLAPARPWKHKIIPQPGKRRLKWLLLASAIGFLVQGNAIYLKAILAQHLIESAWIESLDSGKLTRPWGWADWQPVARLEFPTQQQSFIVLSDISGAALAFGPGLHPEGATPGGPGTTIIGGHRDTHFSVLQQLTKGERIRLQNSKGEWQNYQISGFAIVDSETTSLSWRESAESHLMLITCYPFHSIDPGGPLRYVVNAKAI